MAAMQAPISSMKNETEFGARALVIAPTRELAHQIYNECLKLAQGRKWRTILFSKATASTLADKNVRDKVGQSPLLVDFYSWNLNYVAQISS